MRVWPALSVVLALFPVGLAAQPALVTSGEHQGFTRLVVQFDAPVDWQVGRTVDGYALRVKDRQPDYDLSKVFDLIGKSRLASLKPDPINGDLAFGFACACYAMPFEFRPGIVVIDLHDGTPPKGSSFEEPLAQTDETTKDGIETALPAPSNPPAEPYDWAKLALQDVGKPAGTMPVYLLAPGQGVAGAGPDPSLDALRQSLIEELGRGASQGIIDMAKPKAAPEYPAEMPEGSVAVHLGGEADLIVRQKGEDRSPLGAKGEACIADEKLEVAVWGASRPVSDQIGPIRQGLVGEFDRPDPEAVARAVRFYLFIGFGAEARAMIRAFPDGLEDAPLWESMALALDDEADPNPVFSGMADCDGPASLWATLADPEAYPTDEVGKAAILRTFSALPPHLRRALGPRLVNRFLAVQDIPVATSLRDAILRAPGDRGPEVVLMEAAFAQALGKPSLAEAHLTPLAEAPGPASTDALVELVEQRATLGQSVSLAQVEVLEAALKERASSDEAPRYRHALALARAASGDFDGAFAMSAEAPDAVATLWQVLAQAGPDSALLAHATLGEADLAPMAAKESAGLIADRMLGLGLADQASRWLALDDAAPTLLSARVALANGDPKGALETLAEESSAPALVVKAEAYGRIGDDLAAAAIFAELGKPEAEVSAISRSQDWGKLATDGPDHWKSLATLVASEAGEATPQSDQAGPLAKDQALVDSSASTRDAITNLLEAVKSPVLPTH